MVQTSVVSMKRIVGSEPDCQLEEPRVAVGGEGLLYFFEPHGMRKVARAHNLESFDFGVARDFFDGHLFACGSAEAAVNV